MRASMVLIRSQSVTLKSCASRRAAALAAGVRAGNSGRPSMVNARSHSISTCTRARMTAYSENPARSSAVVRA